MHLFLTTVLPFLGHNHASAGAVLTCRYHNFHGSIIPEFLSDEERVKSFCEAKQQKPLAQRADKTTKMNMQYTNLYNLFVQTPLMQFSPSLIVSRKECAKSILGPLLRMKYFRRTLHRCSVAPHVPLSKLLFLGLSKVQSLIKLDLGECRVGKEHLERIINSFPSLETLSFDASGLSNTTININAPSPPATKTLRSLTITKVYFLFMVRMVPHFTNLRTLELSVADDDFYEAVMDLQPLSSLSLLTGLSLRGYIIDNMESLKNLVHLSSLRLFACEMSDLSFPTQENSTPQLTTLCIENCEIVSTSVSFASLANAPNLHVLKLTSSKFDNDCLQYLDNMVHLRKLDLSRSRRIVGDCRSLKTFMQNVFQLEELILETCRDIGNQGAISGALYSTHSRLRILNLNNCCLVDDDLTGICALKNSLEELDLSYNKELTNEGLVHCKDLVKLKNLNLYSCDGINDLSPLKCLVTLKKLKLYRCHGIADLSPLKDCLKLEELDVSDCERLTDDSFKVFSEEPNSFPSLRVLDLSDCGKLTEKVFAHFSNNINLVYQLRELKLTGVRRSEIGIQMSKFILSSSSPIARDNIVKLKGLRILDFLVPAYGSDEEYKRLREINQSLRNLDD